MRETIATVSAGTLGYITNGIRGAKKAVKVYKKVSNMVKTRSQTARSKSRGRSRSVSVKAGSRSRSSKSGSVYSARSTSVGSWKPSVLMRPYRKRAAKTRITRGFKNKVHKVLAQENPNGVYRKRWVATLSAATSGTQICAQDSYYGADLTSGSDFRFFNEARLKDAASILFNGKTKGIDYGVTTNNFASEGFKYHLNGAEASMKIFNNSPSIYEMVIVKCSSKKNSSSSQTAYARYVAAMSDLQQAGGTAVGVTYATVLPTMIPQMKEYYNMTTYRKELHPGNTFKVRSFLKAQELDWEKYEDNGTNAYFIRNISVEYFIIYRVIPNCGSADSRTYSGRRTVDNTSSCLTVECNEYFSLSAPPNTPVANNIDQYCWFYSDSAGASYTPLNYTKAVTTLSAIV